MRDEDELTPLERGQQIALGMRRRANGGLAAPVYVDESSGFAKRLNYGGLNYAAGIENTFGMARDIAELGGSDANYDRAVALKQEAIAAAPDVYRLDQVKDVGTGLEYLATAAVEQLPTMAAAAAGAALTGGYGRVLGGLVGRGVLTDAAIAGRAGLQRAQQRALSAAAKRAQSAPLNPAVVARQGEDAARRVAVAQAKRKADAVGRRVGRLASREGQRIGEKLGQFAGGTIGTLPAMNRDADEIVRDAEREDVAKIWTANLVAASMGGLANLRYINQATGGLASKEIADRAAPLLQRALAGAKRSVKTGQVEGATEVAQELVQNLGHKWVDDNVEVLSPEALQNYLLAYGVGSVLGTGIGGAIEAGQAGADLVGEAGRATGVALRDRIRAFAETRMKAQETLIQAMRGRASSGPAPGERMTPTPTEQRFQEAERGLKLDDDVDGIDAELRAMQERFEAGDAEPWVGGQNAAQRPLNRPNPRARAMVADPFARSLLSQVPPTSPFWRAPEVVEDAAAAIVNLRNNATVTEAQRLALASLPDWGESPITAGTVFAWQEALEQYQAPLERLRALGAQTSSEIEAAPEQQAEVEALARENETEVPIDRIGDFDADVEAAEGGTNAFGLNDDRRIDPREALSNYAPGTPEHETARESLLRSYFDESSAVLPAGLADKKAPIEVATATTPDGRELQIDIGSLAAFARGRFAQGQQLSAKQALAEAVADLRLAGVELQLRAPKEGGSFSVAGETITLSPTDVRQLNGAAPKARPAIDRTTQTPEGPKALDVPYRAEPTQTNTPLPTMRGTFRDSTRVEPFSPEQGEADPTLRVREAPPVARELTQAGNVKDVKLSNKLGQAAESNETRRLEQQKFDRESARHTAQLRKAKVELDAAKAKARELAAPEYAEVTRLSAQLASAKQALGKATAAGKPKLEARVAELQKRIANAEKIAKAKVYKTTAEAEKRYTELQSAKPYAPRKQPRDPVEIGREIMQAVFDADNPTPSPSMLRRHKERMKDDRLARLFYKRALRGDYAKYNVTEFAWDENAAPKDLQKQIGDAQDRLVAAAKPLVERYIAILERKAETAYAQVGAAKNRKAKSEAKAKLRAAESKVDRANAMSPKDPDSYAMMVEDLKGDAQKSGELMRDFLAAAQELADLKPNGKIAAALESRADGTRTASMLEPEDKRTLEKADATSLKQESEPLPKGAKAKLAKSVKLDDDTLSDLAGRKGYKHDLKVEAQMLNDLLAELGITTPIKLTNKPPKGKERARGSYDVESRTIYIANRLTGAARLEVLAHELGHHIIEVELANASPETRAAIEADHLKWVEQNKGEKVAARIQQSNKPFFMSRKIERAADALGDKLPESSQDRLDYALSFDEYLADQLARALTSNKRATTVIGKFYANLAAKLRRFYDGLFGSPKGEKFKPASSVDAWVNQMFDRKVRAIQNATGVTVPRRSAAAIDLQSFEGVVEYVKYIMSPETRELLLNAVSTGRAARAVLKHFKNDRDAISRWNDSGAQVENRIAMAFQAWVAGAFRTGPEGQNAMYDMMDSWLAMAGISSDNVLAARVFDDMIAGNMQRVIDSGATYDARNDAASVSASMKAYTQMQRALRPIANFWSAAMDSKMERARASGIPAFVKIASLLGRHSGDTGAERGAYAEVRNRTAAMALAFDAAVGKLNAEQQADVLSYLQSYPDDAVELERQSATVQRVVPRLRRIMKQMHEYLVESEVLADGKTIDPAKFFPVVMKVDTDMKVAELRELLSQPKFESEIRDFFDNPTIKDDPVPIGDLVERLVAGAQDIEIETKAADDTAPAFRGANHRVMQFVYKLGNKLDREALARLQTKTMDEVFVRYFMPAIRNAEYTKRFGDPVSKVKAAKRSNKEREPGEVKKPVNRGRLDALLRDMKKQGATDSQIGEAEAMVEAFTGSYGANGSPLIGAFSPTLAQKFSGRTVQSVIQGGLAYQNMRNLPLALIASLVDPMGIAVRSGGDFKTAWTGIKSGFRAMFDKAKREDMQQMLQQLQMADDMVVWQTLNGMYGNVESSAAKTVNEWVFKLNGMSWFTQLTRNMAMVSAHGFIIKHATSMGRRQGAEPNTTSERYIAELGLKPSDVVLQSPTRLKLLTAAERMALEDAGTPEAKAELERDQRVRNAVIQFVDEAVLRPNPQQVPQWHSDPYVGLVTQYKAFLYAIYDQIVRRMGTEIRHGNPIVLLAGAAYLPIIALAELLREFIQHGPDGNPNRKDWGATDYAWMSVERSGLLGPRMSMYTDAYQDVTSDRTPISSQLGPTLSQARNVWQAAAGERDMGKTFEEALPWSAAWKRWNDNL